MVTRLVCAAGFGKMGNIAAVDPGDNLAMIDLNCWAAVGSPACACPTSPRAAGCWRSAPPPPSSPCRGWGCTTATKAFLHSYAKTLHHELLPKGIHVTAVCPLLGERTRSSSPGPGGQGRPVPPLPLASRSKSVVALSLAASA